MKKRRAFLGSALGALSLSPTRAGRAAEPRAAAPRARPLVWPLAAQPQAAVRSFAGHANTVLDIVGRIGTPPNLAIFTEGNHLMALLGEQILGEFPQWAKAHPHYADVELGNVVVLTLPQPIVVQTLRSERVEAFGRCVDEAPCAKSGEPDGTPEHCYDDKLVGTP